MTAYITGSLKHQGQRTSSAHGCIPENPAWQHRGPSEVNTNPPELNSPGSTVNMDDMIFGIYKSGRTSVSLA